MDELMQQVETAAEAYARAEAACMVFLRQAEQIDVYNLTWRSEELVTHIRRYGEMAQRYHAALALAGMERFTSQHDFQEVTVILREMRALELRCNQVLSRLGNLCISHSRALYSYRVHNGRSTEEEACAAGY